MGKLLVLLVVLVPTLLFGWIAVNSRDLPQVDDADLAVPRLANVAPEENVFAGLATVIQRCDADEAARTALEQRGDTAGRERVIAEHAGALAELRRVLSRPHFQVPPAHPDEADMTSVSAYPFLARLLATRAALRWAADDRVAAFDDLALLFRFGARLYGATGGGLVHAMLGVTVHEIGLAELEHQLARHPLSPAEAKQLAGALEAARLPREQLRAVYAVEYEAMKDALQPVIDEHRLPTETLPSPWQGLAPASYLFHPNRTLDAFARDFRELGERAASGCATRLVDEPEPFPAWGYVAPNAVGRVLTSLAHPSFDRYQRRACMADARLSAAQVLLALRAYHGQHGALPDALAALVPELLAAPPPDPFDGEPLAYSRERKELRARAEPLPAHTHDESCDVAEETAEPVFAIPF